MFKCWWVSRFIWWEKQYIFFWCLVSDWDDFTFSILSGVCLSNKWHFSIFPFHDKFSRINKFRFSNLYVPPWFHLWLPQMSCWALRKLSYIPTHFLSTPPRLQDHEFYVIPQRYLISKSWDIRPLYSLLDILLNQICCSSGTLFRKIQFY